MGIGGPATATSTAYVVNPYSATSVPTAYERHLMNRLGCGWSRGTWKQMRADGGPAAWLESQLDPASVPETAKAEGLLGWFPDLLDSPGRQWQRNVSGSKETWEYAKDLGCWTMLRRVYSARQVHETMVDLWSNHLHVNANGGPGSAARFDYDQTIRRHALGRFEDLLVACTLHPAMLVYLDNFRSVRGAPNENHGRELLELHTVGRTSGYTEDMVRSAAVILSGWTVDYQRSFDRMWSPSLHTTGRVQVLGFTDANTGADPALAERLVRYLARHRGTALTVARRLAVRFVSDTPSDALVNRLAETYLANDTDIAATLRDLVSTEEFRASAEQKVRTNAEDLVATSRVLGVEARRPTAERSFARAIAYLHQGMLLYQWPRPDGAPERNAEWSSASRMLSSFRMHWNLTAGYYPALDVTYRSPRSWLPQRRIRLDKYVDHLARELLGRPSTATELEAVCQATGYRPGEMVTAEHRLSRSMFVRLASVLLDTPSHLSR